MSQSAASPSDQSTLIDRYFYCWRHHETFALRELFTDDATFEIHGMDPFIGISQIETYWRRNEHRQTQLQVDHQTLPGDNGIQQAHFVALFYDIVDNEEQSVAGIISFTFTSDRTRI